MKLRPERKSHSTGFHGFRKMPSEGLPLLVLCTDAELAETSRQQRRALRRNNGGGESARSMRRRLKRFRRGVPMRPSLTLALDGVKYFNAWTSRGDRADALLHAVQVGFVPETNTHGTFYAMCGAKVQNYERKAFDPTESHTCPQCRRETTGLHIPVGNQSA